MRTNKKNAFCTCVLITLAIHGLADAAQAGGDDLTTVETTAIVQVEQRADEIKQVNRAIWEFAEVGLEEHRSSRLLIEKLQEAGFQVEVGVSNMPTAFVAEYGQGKPIIGMLAEYDALPDMSQKISPRREPVQQGEPGHACGHSGLGAGALGAALAVQATMQQHQLPGTIRLYGTPAEETLIGKVYMALDGQFDDLDVCLHWHPSTKNVAWVAGSKALISARFTFEGVAAHASVSPESGRSALDAVELMNVGANFLREHLKEDARIHYVITDGGTAPNVVPARASVWYYVRADNHQDARANFLWLQDIAQGAAMMTRTNMNLQIETDCHELIPNGPLAALVTRNLQRVGPPAFTAEEEAFARQLQQPLMDQFGQQFALALDDRVHRETPDSPPSKGSTDVGDVSWRVPTIGFRTTCFIYNSPGHSWQNVAAIGSSIGEKGIIYASKVMAVTAVNLLEDPRLIAAAREDWQRRMEGREYISLIPEGQPPPQSIR